MAKNFVQPGEIITVIAPEPTGVLSGQPLIVGSFFGVATIDAAAGDETELALTGVWELPKAAGALDGGDPIFFAPGTGLSGDSAPTGVLIGAATNGASADDPTVRVRLNGVTLGAPVAG